ncbi:lipid II:glycine glycyltransferase FemX [Halegenticoccus soli]|uniref:lipid II:glycine glycyltransferase FemX n=1 Tax=Halegenticoccus soli TaxID=1985678 RepID=UPI000C6D83D9|nr:GNAT family N-acetyltransferase [Halegenticoccus soli]
MRIQRVGLGEWAEVLPDTGFEVFHRPEALEVIERHSDSELVLLAGYEGDRAVGALPAFVAERSVGRAIFSPPPQSGIQRLGPVLMPASPKRRKRERVNRTFVRSAVEELRADSHLSLLWMIAGVAYDDPRPLGWRGLRVKPRFTYVLDLTRDVDEIRKSFSKSLRREIRDAEDAGVAVEREGLAGVERIYDDVADRYEEQDVDHLKSKRFVTELVDALGERARSYVARGSDGAYVGGVTVLYSNDLAYFWHGGTRTSYEGSSVNALLHWRIIEEFAADPPVETIAGYDLLGANVERLSRYKAKFGGDLVPYYHVESNSPVMDAAKQGYRILHRA